jgi:hypothetical protein
MEIGTFSLTAASALAVLQPYLPTIATKAAEKIGEGLPTTAGKLWGAIKAKFDTKAAAKGALQDLLKEPEDVDLQAAFRVQLRKALEEDEAFAARVRGLLTEAGAQVDVRVGDGAAAVGDHAKAVGKDSVLIEGGVKGDFLGRGAKKTGK